jgi:preprotein translocase subunit YajC
MGVIFMMDLFISSAYAQAGQPATAQNPIMSFIPFVLVFVIMYFFMIRPQKKRAEQEQTFLSKLAQGEEVFTKSGILGKVTGITEKVVTLELEGGSRMKVLKTHIGGSSKTLLSEVTK